MKDVVVDMVLRDEIKLGVVEKEKRDGKMRKEIVL